MNGMLFLFRQPAGSRWRLLSFASFLGNGNSLLLGLQLFCLGKLLLEPVDASLRVDELLATGKERMAARANFNVHVSLMGGAGTETRATRTDHVDFVVCGVDAGFHG